MLDLVQVAEAPGARLAEPIAELLKLKSSVMREKESVRWTPSSSEIDTAEEDDSTSLDAVTVDISPAVTPDVDDLPRIRVERTAATAERRGKASAWLTPSCAKHALHVALCVSLVAAAQFFAAAERTRHAALWLSVDPFEQYGTIPALLLYALRLMVLLAVPQSLFNFLGLTVYNSFPGRVHLDISPLDAPRIVVRIVTRGDYPTLVRRNVQRNRDTLEAIGVTNYIIEVVTDQPVLLARDYRCRETVVPDSYRPRSGARFKARALQFCLEPHVNQLSSDDWIVHLDEETLLTENSVRGILNFISRSDAPDFGQGLITYANEHVVNWFFTLADSFRVADDMGKLRFQFRTFGKPLFSWKGSYVVTRARAELDVTYDHGLDGSIAEDCYFSMIAYQKGYRFGFIDGEMWEKSPFTLRDFLQQRKRWIQGIFLVVHSGCIRWRYKLLLATSLYAWLTVPLTGSNILWAAFFPLPLPAIIDVATTFAFAMNLYMYVFGVLKSFSIARIGLRRFGMLLIGALLTIPFNVIAENIAAVWACIGSKHRFYVVDKNFQKHLSARSDAVEAVPLRQV